MILSQIKVLQKKVKESEEEMVPDMALLQAEEPKASNSRSGANIRLGFEGGQMPLHRRIPHLRGFKNTRKKEFNIINVGH